MVDHASIALVTAKDIAPAIIAGAVTVVGWLALHLFTSTRDREARKSASQAADRVKRLELLLNQSEAQISQFYGPVHGLITQIAAIWEIEERIKFVTDTEKFNRIQHFLMQNYYGPYHEKIRIIIRENMHLIDGATLPDSFYEYIQHSMMQNIQLKLWDDQRIGTDNAEGIDWPFQFNTDIAEGLKLAVARYNDILTQLTPEKFKDKAVLKNWNLSLLALASYRSVTQWLSVSAHKRLSNPATENTV